MPPAENSTPDSDSTPLPNAVHRFFANVMGKDACKGGSLHEVYFQATHSVGEAGLAERNLLEFFCKTQRLPDYQKAEDGVRQGWLEMEQFNLFQIRAGEANDPLKNRQRVLLYQLRGARTRQLREPILRHSSKVCAESAWHFSTTKLLSFAIGLL